jgi:hypothetical protein
MTKPRPGLEDEGEPWKDVDVTRLLAISDRLREGPEQDIASKALARRSVGRAWLGQVVGGTEAVLDVLYQMVQDDPERVGCDSPVQVAASAIEPPSALLAFRSVFPRAEFHVQSVGDPDPRLTLYPGEGTAVWRYNGMQARPAVVPPSPAAVERVRGLADSVWPHIPAAYERARGLAGIPVADLLGVLVHPPAPPAGAAGSEFRSRPDVWIRAVQTLACLGLAHHRIDQPWLGSERRQVMAELLYGPEDWVTEAAGFALVAAAWMDPDARREVGGHISKRWLTAVEASRTREVSIMGSLSHLILACPSVDRNVHDLARTVLAAIRQAEERPPSDLAEQGAQLVDFARANALGSPRAPSGSWRRFRLRRR